MAASSLKELMNDPRFASVTDESERSAIIEKVAMGDDAFKALPEQEQIKVLNTVLGANRAQQQPITQPVQDQTQQQSQEPSFTERMIGPGSPTYSFIKGAIIDPALAANQLLANTGLFGEDIKKGANQAVKYSQYLQEDGKTKLGRDGFDVIEMVGNIVSPANKLIPNTQAANAFKTIANQAVAGGALSALIPVVGEDYWSDLNTQIGFGALISGALPGTALASQKLGSFVAGLPVTKAAREAAIYKYFSNLLGDDKAQAVNELRSVGEIVSGSKPTTGEALSETTYGANVIREQQRLSTNKETSKQFTARFKEQADARLKSLEDVFGNASDLEAAKEARLSTTKPMRERALAEANFYGETASVLEEKLAKSQNQFGSLTTKDKADVIKAQIQNIKANGYYPLTVNGLVENLDNVLKAPGSRSNEMLVSALAKLRGKMVNLADDRGVINSVDLYNIRKEISSDIAEYVQTKGGANASFNAQATATETRLKKLLDAEINKASGSNLWTSYLDKFAEHSRKIDQMEVGTALQNKLGVSLGDVEQAGAFASAVNEAGSMIKRQTGLPRYTKLDEVLTKEQMAAVNSVYADLNRKVKTEKLGKTADTSEGVEKATEVVVPGVLERGVFILRNVLNTLQRGSTAEFDRRVSELMLDPNKMADFLAAIPKSKTKQITQAMMAKMSDDTRRLFYNSYGNLTQGVPTQEIERGVSMAVTKEGT